MCTLNDFITIVVMQKQQEFITLYKLFFLSNRFLSAEALCMCVCVCVAYTYV